MRNAWHSGFAVSFVFKVECRNLVCALLTT
ncbi:DUF3265 domain-containing protein [Vibrio vulnificus]|nr:DUF3265 domain-containing protein [Vibrio vulnificus]ELP4436217.1 DUF3265 domain-containing protein [Vibrio vulnificus]